MRRNRTATFLRVIGLIAGIIVAFVWLQEPIRLLETRITVALTNLGPGQDVLLAGTRIIVFPDTSSFFVAILTPSCSALAAVLAILTLSRVTPRSPTPRKALAVSAALAVVVGGNFARLVGSVVVGRWAGRGSLVLFHDVVGGILTFVYILAGYVLMLWLLLPAERAPEPEYVDVAA